MTTEQNQTMHLEIANGLETSGYFCVFCKSKRSEQIKMEQAMDDMTCAPYQISSKQCVCLQTRPRMDTMISSVYETVGMKLLSAYFQKKAAQAWNDINCPVQALNYAEKAEKMLPDAHIFIRESNYNEEKHFDQTVLSASIKRTQARSCLLLGNTYSATVFAQEALSELGIDLIFFYGVFSPNEFKNILESFSLLHAEEIIKVIGVLSQTIVAAKAYIVALRVLEIEFVALTHYPTQFLQILNFQMSLFICRTEMKPKKKFFNLENNTLRICRHRLQTYKVSPNLKEIQAIGKAYLVHIEANLSKNRLQRADSIANEAFKILNYVRDHTCIPFLCVLLTEIHLFGKKYEECWKYLNYLNSISDVDDNFDICSHYFCELSNLIIFSNQANSSDKKKKAGIKKDIQRINKFASNWAAHFVATMQSDLAFYVSAKMSNWCLEVGELIDWPEKDVIFKQCYDITVKLFENQDKDSYWSISGCLTHFRTMIMVDNQKKNKDFVFDRLKKMKKKIQLHFPVYKKKYDQLLLDVKMSEVFPTPDEDI